MTFDPVLHSRAADELRALCSEIASQSVMAQLAASPGLAERFGPRGIEASLRDARHNVDHLAEAVALGDAEAFSTYVVWLRGVLVAAHVPAQALADHLDHLAIAVRELVGPNAAAVVGPYIDRARDRLGKEAS